MNTFLSIVATIEDIDKIAIFSDKEKIEVFYLPVTLECYLYLKSKNYNIEKLSKYFLKYSHRDCIRFIESIRKNGKGCLKHNSTWKEYRIQLSFNVSYIIFIIEIVNSILKNNKFTSILSTGETIINDEPVFSGDNIISDILRLSCAEYNLDLVEISLKSELILSNVEREYHIDARPMHASKIFTPSFGYNIGRLTRLILRKVNVGFIYFSNKQGSTVRRLLKELYYKISYNAVPLYYTEVKKESLEKCKININESDFQYKGVDFYSLIEKKLGASYYFYKNLDKFIDKIDTFYKEYNPLLTIAWASRGITDAMAEISIKHKKEALCVSHGTVSESYNKLDKLYKKYIAESVIFNNYPTVAIQSPVANSFFRENDSDSTKLITGNLIFSKKKIKYRKIKENNKTIVYAVTLKPLSNLQFLGVETYDEFLDNIKELNELLSPDYNFVVQVHPCFKSLLKRYSSQFKDITLCFGNIENTINNSTAIISFSSTSIEDALNCEIPVVLYDRYDRYKHCDSLDLENSKFSPYPVYYVRNKETLLRNVADIVDKKNISNIDWSSHIYSDELNDNLINYVTQSMESNLNKL